MQQARIRRHYWGTYTETLVITSENPVALAKYCNEKCALSAPVGTPSSGTVKSKGWIALEAQKGIVAVYSGQDTAKVAAFLVAHTAPANFNSIGKSLDLSAPFSLDFPA